LQPRDYRLLRALVTLRVIDRDAAQAIGPFGSTTRANTRLQTLTKAGLLAARPIGTTRGGHKHLYALTPRSARLLDVPSRPAPWGKNTLLAASIGLEHLLRLNALYLLLMHPSVPEPGISVRTWRTFLTPPPGSAQLIPDAYIELETAAGVRAWFVEVDCGTETSRVWKKKAERYLAYAMTGAFTQSTGVSQFGVLVLAPSARRIRNIRSTVATVTSKLFWFAPFDVLTPQTFWSATWLRPVGDDQHSLVPHLCATAPTVDA
jgi:hypothetical protein